MTGAAGRPRREMSMQSAKQIAAVALSFGQQDDIAVLTLTVLRQERQSHDLPARSVVEFFEDFGDGRFGAHFGGPIGEGAGIFWRKAGCAATERAGHSTRLKTVFLPASPGIRPESIGNRKNAKNAHGPLKNLINFAILAKDPRRISVEIWAQRRLPVPAETDGSPSRSKCSTISPAGE